MKTTRPLPAELLPLVKALDEALGNRTTDEAMAELELDTRLITAHFDNHGQTFIPGMVVEWENHGVPQCITTTSKSWSPDGDRSKVAVEGNTVHVMVGSIYLGVFASEERVFAQLPDRLIAALKNRLTLVQKEVVQAEKAKIAAQRKADDAARRLKTLQAVLG